MTILRNVKTALQTMIAKIYLMNPTSAKEMLKQVIMIGFVVVVIVKMLMI